MHNFSKELLKRHTIKRKQKRKVYCKELEHEENRKRLILLSKQGETLQVQVQPIEENHL